MAVNKKMHGYFLIVAEEIGCHWTTLGRRLNVPNSTIENIEHELGKSLEDRAYHVLERWYQKNGQAGATREVLGKALEAIGQKSIAEKIGYHGSHEIEREDTAKDKPSRRSIKDLEIRLGEELGKILKYCQDSIPSCNARELGHTLKFLECVQALNNEIIKGTGSDDPNDDPEIAKIKRNNQIRHTHTDQTIRLINDQLLKSRPVSEILHRCTSIVILPRRSDTDSAVELTRHQISSPVSTTTSSRLLPFREMIFVERTNTEQAGTPQIIRCCPNCSNCFEQGTCVIENVEMDKNCSQSNPDPMLHERIAYNQDGPHDAKL